MNFNFTFPHGPLGTGLRVTQNACFSLLTHTKYFLWWHFVIRLQTLALVFGWTDTRTHVRMHGGGRTDRRGSQNSYLDIFWLFFHTIHFIKYLLIDRLKLFLRVPYYMSQVVKIIWHKRLHKYVVIGLFSMTTCQSHHLDNQFCLFSFVVACSKINNWIIA